MAVHGGKWQMGEPRAGGQPQTALGLTHWEVVQGVAGEKSLPPMPGQTDFGRHLVCSRMVVQESR